MKAPKKLPRVLTPDEVKAIERLRDRLLFAVIAAPDLFSGGSAVCSRVIL